MTTDRLTKALLFVVAASLSAIAINQYTSPRLTAFAQEKTQDAIVVRTATGGAEKQAPIQVKVVDGKLYMAPTKPKKYQIFELKASASAYPTITYLSEQIEALRVDGWHFVSFTGGLHNVNGALFERWD